MTHPSVIGDQRRLGSELRQREADNLARDLVNVTRRIATWQLNQHQRTELDICAGCGSLERADRSCQVCRARRTAA